MSGPNAKKKVERNSLKIVERCQSTMILASCGYRASPPYMLRKIPDRYLKKPYINLTYFLPCRTVRRLVAEVQAAGKGVKEEITNLL
jgi:hypothetical protein